MIDVLVDGDLVVLAGAGVSMAAPAGLPSGTALRDLVVDALFKNDALPVPIRKELLTLRPKMLARTPELTFQALGGDMGLLRVGRAFAAFDEADPNYNHEVLADVAVRNAACTVLTTNFDSLIEASLARRGVSGQIPVFHLHGSLKRGARLRLTANQTYGTLTRAANSRIGESGGRGTLWVVGYSGADPDVLTAIKRWPWAMVVWQQRRGGGLPLLAQAGWQPGTRVVPLVEDLDETFRRIGRRLGTRSRGVSGSAINPMVEAGVIAWGNALPWDVALVGLFKLLLEQDLIDDAREPAAKAWQLMAADARSRSSAALLANDVAFSEYVAGRFSALLAWARKGRRIAVVAQDWAIAGLCENTIGLGMLELAEQGRPGPRRRAAGKHFANAETLLMRADRDAGYSLADRRWRILLPLGRVLNNQGLLAARASLGAWHQGRRAIAEGKLAEARSLFTRSQNIKRSIGDLSGSASSAGNLGLLLAKTTDLSAGARMSRRAHQLLTVMDPAFAGYLARELAIAYRARVAHVKKSVIWFERALADFARCQGVEFDIALTNWNLAMALAKMRRDDEAAILRGRSERALKELGQLDAVDWQSDWSTLERI